MNRKLLLSCHIATSVSWIGAVFCFLVLTIAAGRSSSSEAVNGIYSAINLIGLYVIVPLSLGALVTGLFQALFTPWGLFRHYWVFIKFVLTVFATLALLLHQFTAVSRAAEIAALGEWQSVELGQLRVQLIADSGLAILVLMAALLLSIFKPWGLTKYGLKDRPEQEKSASPLGLKIFVAAIGLLVLVFVVLHLTGRGLGHVH